MTTPNLKNRVKLLLAMKQHSHLPFAEETSIIKKIIKEIREDKNNHNLSFSITDPTKVSYLFSSKNSDFDSEKRTKTTLARYIRRELNIDFSALSDQYLNFFCEKVMAEITPVEFIKNKIQLLNGKDIVEAYRDSPHKSCMSGTAHCNKTELYSLNENKVSLILYNKSVRALLWTCDDGTKVVDRIYPAACVESLFIEKWAKSNKYITRKDLHFGGYDDNQYLSDDSVREITVSFENKFPYMDTFKFVYDVDHTENTCKLGNFKPAQKLLNYLATNTKGKLPWKRELFDCYLCDCEMEEEEGHSIGDDHCVCDSCYENDCFVCMECNDIGFTSDAHYTENCDSFCEYCFHRKCRRCNSCSLNFYKSEMHSDNDTYICESCFDEHYITCEKCDGFVLAENAIFIESEHINVCESCCDYHFVHCEKCNEWIDKKLISEIDGEYFCKSCVVEKNSETDEF